MTTIKSYTSVEQSKKLAEFLPLESADMYYDYIVDAVTGELFIPNNGSTIMVGKGLSGTIAAWSLAALLRQIPISYKDEGRYCFALINTNSKADPFTWCSCYEDDHGTMMFECYAENQVDACVDMIIKLKKFNLL